jgi:hypothetical protein
LLRHRTARPLFKIHGRELDEIVDVLRSAGATLSA